MTRWSDALEKKREWAALEAATVLVDRGFSRQPSGKWTGELELPDDNVTVEVVLPREFPDKLPEIFLDAPDESTVRSHIEQTGKICIATASGNLLDTERPGALLSESLERAKSVLCATGQEQEADVHIEFVAYWPERNSDAEIWSIVDPSRASGEVVYATIALNGTHLLFAADKKSLKKWARNATAAIEEIRTGFFAKLDKLPIPPKFDQALSTSELDHLLSRHMAKNEYDVWQKWDSGRRPVPAMLLAAKLDDGSYTVFAVRKAQLTDAQKRAIVNPYSRKKPPAKKVREALRDNAIGRRAVTRLDLPHLLRRTAGPLDLEGARVAIVGCGAVGSQIAVAAAAAGVQFLTLVDNEVMRAENVHRHALGVEDIKKPKVVGLSKLIIRRFPHVQVIPRAETIESVFDQTPDIIDEIDLIIFALGDETIERSLNDYLGPSIMRLHTWVEPLGIGGHCLLIPGGEHKGCYECLYSRDNNSMLYNMTSLCEPGQVFQRTTGGCAGTFTPFGYVDTLDAASRATRMMIAALTQQTVEYGLLSWIGNEHAFLAAGYKLSKRGKVLLLSRESYRDDIKSDDCKVCTKW